MSIGMITILAAVLAFVLTSLLGLWLIPLLRRIRCTQPISDNAPSWHRKKDIRGKTNEFQIKTKIKLHQCLFTVANVRH